MHAERFRSRYLNVDKRTYLLLRCAEMYRTDAVSPACQHIGVGFALSLGEYAHGSADKPLVLLIGYRVLQLQHSLESRGGYLLRNLLHFSGSR